jgi:hypothetical protein
LEAARIAIERAGGRGRRGVAVLRDVLEVWMPGIDPSSPAEMRLLRRLSEWGIGRSDLQVVVHDSAGRFVGRLDPAWPARRVALEYDGRRYHGPRSLERDEHRHAALVGLGWRVRHVVKSDLLPGEAELRDWLRRHVTPAA